MRRLAIALSLLTSACSTTPIQVVYGTEGEVETFCRKHSHYRGNRDILACTMPAKKVCFIVWERGGPRRGDLWNHELGHCHGREYKPGKFH